MDFAGKCNGQIQVNITPLEDLASLGKYNSSLNIVRESSDVPQSARSSPWREDGNQVNMERVNAGFTGPSGIRQQRVSMPNEYRSDDTALRLPHSLDDLSTSFLSVSLKQKLTELDQITKRLESRLRDVTSTAFEEDFENEFEVNAAGMPNDNENASGQQDAPVFHDANTWKNTGNDSTRNSCPRSSSETENGNSTEVVTESDDNENELIETGSNQAERSSGYPLLPRVDPFTDCDPDFQQDFSHNHGPTGGCNSSATSHGMSFAVYGDYPERGARVHINHLLDKLSLQPTQYLFPSGAHPIGGNILDLLRTLRQNNNNIQERGKYKSPSGHCTVPTQTEELSEPVDGHESSQSLEERGAQRHGAECRRSTSESPSKANLNNRMSLVIREELMAEESTDSSKSDELSTYLITSNLRHMDFNTMHNPLTYHHLVPELNSSPTLSPESEAAEQLDQRYTQAFCASINRRLDKVETVGKVDSLPNYNSQFRPDTSESAQTTARMTPPGTSVRVDSNTKSIDNLESAEPNNSHERRSGVQVETNLPVNCSASAPSEISTAPLSRQAPEGGNPIEENPLASLAGQQVQQVSSNNSTDS